MIERGGLRFNRTWERKTIMSTYDRALSPGRISSTVSGMVLEEQKAKRVGKKVFTNAKPKRR